MSTLGEKLRDAANTAKSLAAVTDQLNDRIVKLENAVIMLGLGVTASVLLNPTPCASPNQEGEPSVWLTFQKHDGAWGLFLKRPSGIVPLIKSSRQERVLATAQFSALIDELLRSLSTAVSDVEQGIASLDSLLEALQQLR